MSGLLGVTVALVLAVLAGACGTSGDRSDDGAGGAADAGSTPVESPADESLVVEPVAETVVVAPKLLLTAAPERPPLRRFTVVAAGDLLIHTAVMRSAAAHAGGDGHDFRPMFDPVREVIAGADLALCHLENPLSVDGGDLSSYPIFNAPFELADGIAHAGFDGCSFASNHTYDRGEAGIDASLGHLDRVGVGHAGAARSPEEAETIRVYDVDGVRVAHLSATYGLNGFRLPADRPWRAELIDPERLRARAERARAEGADVVLASLHWGNEYQRAPTAWQRDVAAALSTSPDIDLVIGHHAHVVQPVEQVGDLWVAFGLGNLLSNMLGADRQDGVILRVAFVEDRAGGFTVEAVEHLPTRVAVDDGHRIVPAPPDSWARTVEAMGPLATPITGG